MNIFMNIFGCFILADVALIAFCARRKIMPRILALQSALVVLSGALFWLQFGLQLASYIGATVVFYGTLIWMLIDDIKRRRAQPTGRDLAAAVEKLED